MREGRRQIWITPGKRQSWCHDLLHPNSLLARESKIQTQRAFPPFTLGVLRGGSPARLAETQEGSALAFMAALIPVPSKAARS